MRPARRAVVVELTGPAGAGKSAVLKALEHGDPGIRPLRRLREVRHVPLLSRHLAALLPAAPAMVGQVPRHAWTVARHLARLGALRDVVRRQASGPCRAIVLDEGPVYSVGMLRGRVANGALGRACERALLEWVDTLDLIVWLDAPDAVLAQRINSRAKAHEMKHRDVAVVAEFLARHRDWLRGAVAALAGAPAVRLLAFRTERETPEEIAQHVLDAVAQAVGHASDG